MSLTLITRYPDPPGATEPARAVGTTLDRALANLPADTTQGELLDGALALVARLGAEQLREVVRAIRPVDAVAAPIDWTPELEAEAVAQGGYRLVPLGAIALPDALPLLDPYPDLDVSEPVPFALAAPDVIDAPQVIDMSVTPDDDEEDADATALEAVEPPTPEQIAEANAWFAKDGSVRS